MSAVQRAYDLLHQLDRQMQVQARHGLAAHEVQSIRLVPRGYAEPASFAERRDHEEGRRPLPMLYGSIVTMKSGEVRHFPDHNIKAELDGPNWRRP